jgi:hypothetical protein
MEYDVPIRCSDMDWPSWMIGDNAQECALSANAGSHEHRKVLCLWHIMQESVA